MYKRLLVPVDGSELSLKALDGAIEFAKYLGASVVVMTVVEPYSYTNLSEYRPESIEQYEERVETQASELLAKCKAQLEAAGVPADVAMAKNFSPAEAILAQAKREGADLIVMSSHGRTALAAVFLGSETQKVLTQANIPVMVYR